jgi:hypothetical protein
MEVEESNQPLTNGVFQLTMETFSEEQSANTRTIDGLTQAVKELAEKTDQMIAQAVPISPEPLADEIRDDIVIIRKAITGRPPTNTRKFQILLFPEQDRKLFYRIVFGRWLMWLTVMLLLNNLYRFGVNWSNNKSKIEQVRLQNDQTRKAWELMYKDGTKGTRKTMNEAYNRVDKGQKETK